MEEQSTFNGRNNGKAEHRKTPEERQAARREWGGRVLYWLGTVVALMIFLAVAYTVATFLS